MQSTTNMLSKIVFVFLIVLLVVFVSLFISKFFESTPTKPKPPPDPPVDPNPPVDPIKINIEEARKQIPAGCLGNLKNYTINGETTGIYPTWNTDPIELGKLCDEITMGICYAYNNKTSKDTKMCLDVAYNFLERYYQRLLQIQNTTFTKIPWGNSNSEFSINSTCMAAYYLLLPEPNCPKLAASIILLLVQSPKLSLGIEMKEYNAAYVTGPYVLAKHCINHYVEKSEVQFVMDYLKFNLINEAGASGVHRDGSFVSENLQIYSECDRLSSFVANYIYSLFGVVSNLQPYYNKARMIIPHPNIGISMPAMYGRNKDLTFITDKNAKLGIQVMPYSKFLRYFTEDFQFAVKGITKSLAYYSADLKNYQQLQYWTMYRNVHVKESRKTTKYPDHSLITNSQPMIELKPTEQEHIKNYFTDTAESFVLQYNGYGLLWQKYTLSNIMPNIFITELIIINSIGKKIENKISIENKTNKDAQYYLVSQPCSLLDYEKYLAVEPIPANTTKQYMVTYDLAIKQLHPSFEIQIKFPINLSDKIVVNKQDNFGVLLDNNQPKVVAPITLETESETIQVKINNRDTIFKFNNNENQYTTY